MRQPAPLRAAQVTIGEPRLTRDGVTHNTVRIVLGTGSDFLDYYGAVGAPGIVREWHAEHGWGVIDSPDAPGGCWVHQSHLDMEGFRGLSAGQVVELTFDDRCQDGYLYRAIQVVVPGVPASPTFGAKFRSDAYRSQVVLRFDE